MWFAKVSGGSDGFMVHRDLRGCDVMNTYKC